jgi:hypothetical protein
MVIPVSPKTIVVVLTGNDLITESVVRGWCNHPRVKSDLSARHIRKSRTRYYYHDRIELTAAPLILPFAKLEYPE